MKCNSYLISLVYPTKKIEYLKQYNITPIFIKGINGKKLSNQSIIPDTTLGCALSHQLVWKTFLQTDDEYAVVFEDDVVVEDDFVNTVNTLIERKYEIDLILLGDFRIKTQNINNNFDDLIAIYYFSPGLHAYFINRKGAKNLLQQTTKIRTHLDLQLIILHLFGKITKASLINRVAYQTSTNYSSSQTQITPLLLNKMYRKVTIDKMVTLEYFMSCNWFKIFNKNVNLNCVLIFILGFFISKLFNFVQSIIIFILLYSEELINQREIDVVLLHFVLYIIPIILKK